MKSKATKQPTSTPPGPDNDICQGAINAMAHEIFVIKQAGKLKASELEKLTPAVDIDEVPFLNGVPFEFPYEAPNGTICTVRGKLRLRNQRNWELADVTVLEK